MAGRKPKSASERKSRPIGLRFTPKLLDRIEQSRKDNNTASVAAEITRLIERAFTEDQRVIEEDFGGKQTYGVLLLIAQLLKKLDQSTGRQWQSHPWTFQHAKLIFGEVLAVLKPDGDPDVPPDEITDHLTVAAMSQAEAKVPHNEVSRDEARRRIAKFPLGRSIVGSGLAELEYARKGFLDRKDIGEPTMTRRILSNLAVKGPVPRKRPGRPSMGTWVLAAKLLERKGSK